MEGEARAAYYEAAVVLRTPDGTENSFMGRVHGFVAKKADGTGGFGYDPIFFHPGLGRTFGRASREEKDRYSHRGEAIRKMREHLEQVLREGQT